MEKILKIDYEYRSLLKNITFSIDLQNKKFTIIKNNIQNEIVLEESILRRLTDNIIGISMYWKEMNIKNNIIDGFELTLIIHTKEKNITKYFKNVIPENIDEFNKIIDEVIK